MRKALVLTVLSAATLFSVPALAADKDSKIGVGGDAMLVLPIGDFSDSTGVQFGALGRFGYRVIPQLEITGRIGYIYGFSKSTEVGPVKSDVGASVIPLWGGARYFFFADSPLAGPYAGGELGFNFMNYRASVSGTGTSADVDGDRSYTRFGFSAFGGYVISPELPIDIRGQFIHYNLIGKGDESAAIGLGISVGYTYQL
jgi:hypothetical protein